MTQKKVLAQENSLVRLFGEITNSPLGSLVFVWPVRYLVFLYDFINFLWDSITANEKFF